MIRVRRLNLLLFAVFACAGLFGIAYLLQWRTVEAASGILLLPLLAALTFKALLRSLGYQD